MDFTFEKNFGLYLDGVLKSQDWIWIAMVWYGLILHFCDSNHEITQSRKRKYNNIKDH